MKRLFQNRRTGAILYASIVAAILTAMTTAIILPESANAFAAMSQTNANGGPYTTAATPIQQQSTQVTTMTPTNNGTSATTANNNTNNSLNGSAVRLLNIHTMPTVLHKGDTFKVVATVNNGMQKPIRYTTDCSPLSPSATFDKKIPIVNMKFCNIFPVLQSLNPGKNATIYLPSKFRGDFSAAVTGEINGTVRFNYQIQNSNVSQNVTMPFSFSIMKQGAGNNNTLFTAANLDEVFKLKFNSTGLITSENLTLKFVHVADSRCPSDAFCIWEGDGVVSLNVTKDGKDLGSVMLGATGQLANNTQIVKTLSVGGQRYSIHLLSLSPYPSLSQGPISQSDYVATLVVTKPDTKVSIVSLKEGERDGPLNVTKIYTDHITGLAFREFPVLQLNSTAVKMNIGDSVSNGCNITMTLLSIHDKDSAAFLKLSYPHRICPL